MAINSSLTLINLFTCNAAPTHLLSVVHLKTHACTHTHTYTWLKSYLLAPRLSQETRMSNINLISQTSVISFALRAAVINFHKAERMSYTLQSFTNPLRCPHKIKKSKFGKKTLKVYDNLKEIYKNSLTLIGFMLIAPRARESKLN